MNANIEVGKLLFFGSPPNEENELVNIKRKH